MPTEISSFKAQNGKVYPVIMITGTKGKSKFFPVTLGLTKAQLVLDNIEAIRQFVASVSKPVQDDVPVATASDDTLIVD